LVLLGLLALPAPVHAHDLRWAYLDLKQTGPETYDVLWKTPELPGHAGKAGVADFTPRFPATCVELTEPLRHDAGGARIVCWSLRHPGGLAGQTIHIDGLQGASSDVLVRHERLDGTVQFARLTPDQPDLLLAAASRASDVVTTYLGLGVGHILLGIDHLLFVLALLLLTRGAMHLVKTITAFTLAHSITLALATLDLVHVRSAPVEACIALSIVFVAAEIVHAHQGRPGITARAPWIVAFAFGLLHGFGFAGALREVGLPEDAIPLALLFFNLGVELGQLLFVAAIVLSRWMARRLARHLRLPAPAWAWRIVPYGIGTLAMLWLLERTLGAA
jgi:hydrogenase/urease accessory protein HupE